MTVINVFLFLLLAVAVYTDLQSDKIPNWLILSGLGVGIWTTDRFYKNSFIFISIILIFFPIFQMGALGAGDIKCLAMLSFYLTVSQMLSMLFFTFLIGTIWGMGKSIFYRTNLQKKKKIHLAVPIFLGTLISVGGTYL